MHSAVGVGRWNALRLPLSLPISVPKNNGRGRSPARRCPPAPSCSYPSYLICYLPDLTDPTYPSYL